MLPVGTRVGPYEVVDLLGEGGMGQVYRARDSRLARDIALKVLPQDSSRDGDAIARFEREARAIASLTHPNILAVHDFGNHGGTFYFVTELLEGETLRDRLALSPLGWRKAVEIGAEIAEALAAAHARSIVHRDLKPENVFLTTQGRVKILDFGLAQTDPLFSATDETTVTTKFRTDPGTVIGTLGYIAPEQLRGELVEGTADIFSLGCILFEMVTQRRPFHRGSGAATIAAILKDDIPRDALADNAPPEVQRLIEGCVEKNPVQRFQSAKDLALTMRMISSSTDLSASFISRVRRPRKSRTIDSIAVLPLQNVSHDPETDYLSDGITEGIINRLSQLPKLKVMARSTVFRYRRDARQQLDPQTVGRDLRVKAVLTGRLQHVGDRIIINVELVDSTDGAHLWGEQYNRQLADLVQLQQEMSAEIAEKLRLRLSGAERKKLRKQSTVNAEAYQLYLKGRYHWNKRTEESLKKSANFFREAIESDPSFAGAYAGLADTFITLGTNIPLPPREAMPKAKAAAMKAIEIDDGHAEAWASLAAVHWWFDWNARGAEQAYLRAIDLNPNYANGHDGYGMFLCAQGRFDEAIEQLRKAADLDPLSLIIGVHSGWPYYFARDYDAAIRCFEKTLELDDHFIPAHGWRGMALGQKQRFGDALESFRRALQVDHVPILTAMLAHTHAIAGNRAEAERLLAALQKEEERHYISPYDIAVIHAGLGDNTAALDALDRALDDRSAWMVFLNVDPRLDVLRNEPRFRVIAAKLA